MSERTPLQQVRLRSERLSEARCDSSVGARNKESEGELRSSAVPPEWGFLLVFQEAAPAAFLAVYEWQEIAKG